MVMSVASGPHMLSSLQAKPQLNGPYSSSQVVTRNTLPLRVGALSCSGAPESRAHSGAALKDASGGSCVQPES